MNFIPIANLRSRKHKNGKTITATFDESITATFDESLPSTEEVGTSSRAANDVIGGQAPSREDQTELEDHHQYRPDDDDHPDPDPDPDPDFEIPSLLRGFPEYNLATKLLDVDPNHYGILAGLSNSITFIPEKYVRKTRKVFSMYMQRLIDDPTELNWKKFFLLSTILFDNDSMKLLLKDRKSLLMSRLVSLERDEWVSFTFGSLSTRKSRDASDTTFTNEQINKAATRYFKVGEIGKAFAKLKQDRRKIVPSRDVFQQLQQKHPSPGDSGLSAEEIQSIYAYDITRDEDVEAIRADSRLIETVLR